MVLAEQLWISEDPTTKHLSSRQTFFLQHPKTMS